MTIRDLYEMACSYGFEDRPLAVYVYKDCTPIYNEEVEYGMISEYNDEVIIGIDEPED